LEEISAASHELTTQDNAPTSMRARARTSSSATTRKSSQSAPARDIKTRITELKSQKRALVRMVKKLRGKLLHFQQRRDARKAKFEALRQKLASSEL